MTQKNPKVDACFKQAKKWPKELAELRRIVLGCGLAEELKWGKPFYTFEEANVAVIWEFKDHCALGFCKGALLKDAKGILSRIGENAQAPRKVRFTSVDEIRKLEPVLKAYLGEAVDVEKAGLKVTPKKTSDFVVPPEVQKKLRENPALKTAFAALTPGRQRGYLLYFAGAKQSQTRESRVEKCAGRILNGKGLMDCVCGRSRKLPACDGSHKFAVKKAG